MLIVDELQGKEYIVISRCYKLDFVSLMKITGFLSNSLYSAGIDHELDYTVK